MLNIVKSQSTIGGVTETTWTIGKYSLKKTDTAEHTLWSVESKSREIKMINDCEDSGLSLNIGYSWSSTALSSETQTEEFAKSLQEALKIGTAFDAIFSEHS